MPILKSAKIDFDRIELDVDDVFNYARSGGELGDVRGLAASIKQTGGTLSPMLVWHRRLGGGQKPHVTPDGREVHDRYILVAGRRRHAALALIRKEEGPEAFKQVDVRMIEGNLDDALFAQGIENIQREDPGPAGLAGWINALIGRGHTQSAIAKRIGKPASYVSLALAFHNRASEPLREEAAAGGVSFQAADALSHLPEAEQRAAVAEIREEVAAAEAAGEEPKKVRAVRAKAATKAAKAARDKTERPSVNASPSKGDRVRHIEALSDEGKEPKAGTAAWGAYRALLWSLGKKPWPRDLPKPE